MEAIKAFVEFGIRPPISPVLKTIPTSSLAERFSSRPIASNVTADRNGPNAGVNFTPPPPQPDVTILNGQVSDQLRQVGTFDPNFLNEVNTNGAPSLGANGFVPPSLLSLFAFPQTFFHNGAAVSLDQVMENVTHRSAGTGGIDTLTNFQDRAKVVKFLQSIDAATSPIPLPESLEATEANGQTRVAAATAPTLTVNDGTGSRVTWMLAPTVTVTANPPPSGQEFSGWSGYIQILANPSLSTTTATMPSIDVTISATYADVSSGGSLQ